MTELKKDQPKDVFEAAQLLHKCIERIPEEMREQALRWALENFDMSIGTRPQKLQEPEVQAGMSQHTVPPKSQDIKSFVESKAPQTDAHFATVVAYYYCFEALGDDCKETIDPSTLRDSARLANWKRLGQPAITLRDAKRAGLLDSPARGEYSINAVGENLVAMTLPGDANSSPKRARAKKKPTKKKKSVDSSTSQHG